MLFDEETGAHLPYSEEVYLASCAATGKLLDSAHATSSEVAELAHTLTGLLTRIAVLPYIYGVLGMALGLAIPIPIAFCGLVSIETAEGALCMCAPMLLSVCGPLLAWKQNRQKYVYLCKEIQHRPAVWSLLQELKAHDPVIQRPLSSLACMLHASSKQPSNPH